MEERRDTHLPRLKRLADMARDGRKVLLPLLEREIPLILDTWAKPELGSGCVKITPAHDPNDYDVWTRHQDEIEAVNILNPDGTLNANAGAYQGLDRFVGRKQVVKDLEAQGAAGGRRGPRDRDRPLRPLQDPHRTLPLQAVVREDGRCGRRRGLRQGHPGPVHRPRPGPGGHGRRRGRVDQLHRQAADLPPRPGALLRHLSQLAFGKARLVHQPPALVGPPHPGLARRLRRCRRPARRHQGDSRR